MNRLQETPPAIENAEAAPQIIDLDPTKIHRYAKEIRLSGKPDGMGGIVFDPYASTKFENVGKSNIAEGALKLVFDPVSLGEATNTRYRIMQQDWDRHQANQFPTEISADIRKKIGEVKPAANDDNYALAA
jgi:hypothetical protein